MDTLVKPSIPLVESVGPFFKRNQRDAQWKNFADKIAAIDAGRAMVIRGSLRRIKANELRWDEEGWPSVSLPDPVPFESPEVT